MLKIKKVLLIRIINLIIIGNFLFSARAYPLTINSSSNLRVPLASNDSAETERQKELQMQMLLKKHGLSRFLTEEETLVYLGTVSEVIALHTERPQPKDTVERWIKTGMVLIAERTDGTKVFVSAPPVVKAKLVPGVGSLSKDISSLLERIQDIVEMKPEGEYSKILELPFFTKSVYNICMDTLSHYTRNLSAIFNLLVTRPDKLGTSRLKFIQQAKNLTTDPKGKQVKSVYDICIDTLSHYTRNPSAIFNLLVTRPDKLDASRLQFLKEAQERFSDDLRRLKGFNEEQLKKEIDEIEVSLVKNKTVSEYRLNEKLTTARKFIGARIDKIEPLLRELEGKIAQLENQILSTYRNIQNPAASKHLDEQVKNQNAIDASL